MVFSGHNQPPAVGAFPSSWSQGPTGMLAAFRLLVRQGRPAPERLDLAWTRLAGTGNVLVVAEPLQVRPTDEEVRALMDWVRAGNTLLYMVGTEVPADSAKRASPLLDDELGLGPRPERAQSAADELISGLRNVAAAPAIVRTAAPSPLTMGVRYASILGTVPLVLGRPGLPVLVGAEGGNRMVYRSEDRGSVYIAGSPSLLSNELVGRDDNLILLVNLAELARGGNVLFDEYHHGYYEAPPLTTAYARRVLWALAAQLVLVGATFLLSRGRRFGPLKGRGRVQRRRGLEFVDALAELYRRGRAGSHAARRLWDDFRDEMSGELRLPRSATPDQLARAIAERTGRGAGSVHRHLLDAERAAVEERVSARRLLSAARALTQLRKEVLAS